MKREVIYIELTQKEKEDYEELEKVLYLCENLEEKEQSKVIYEKMFRIGYGGTNFKKTLLKLVRKHAQKGEKMLVFSTYGTIAKEMYRYIKQEGITECFLHTGEVSKGQRELSLEIARTSFNSSIIIATDATNIGFRFPEASVLIHLDCKPTDAALHQREGRIKDIGMNAKEKNIYYFSVEKTMHERRTKQFF